MTLQDLPAALVLPVSHLAVPRGAHESCRFEKGFSNTRHVLPLPGNTSFAHLRTHVFLQENSSKSASPGCHTTTPAPVQRSAAAPRTVRHQLLQTPSQSNAGTRDPGCCCSSPAFVAIWAVYKVCTCPAGQQTLKSPHSHTANISRDGHNCRNYH